MTRYMVVIERGDSSWGAHVPDLPGCVAVGETRDEVVYLIREAISLHIEELKREGLPVHRPTSGGSSLTWRRPNTPLERSGSAGR